MWQLQSVLTIGLLVCAIRRTQSCYNIVEKGKTTEFRCTLPNNSTLVTWQALTGNNILNLTTCNMATSVCTDQQPLVYQGRVLSSLQGTYTIGLNITSARINETRFRCLPDAGVSTEECRLEVYGWPSTPTRGGVRLTNQYVEVIFSTVAYPDVQAVLHRRRTDLSNDDFNKSCSRNPSTSDPNSEYNITCTWRIPFAKMLLSNAFYVEMSALVTNQSLVNRSPVVSNDTTVDIGAVTVSLNNCPEVIRKGTSATCTCTSSSSGISMTAQARWFTADEKEVGVADSSDGSSTLTVSFDASDPNPTYQCRGTNPTREYPFIKYEPTFSSSVPVCATTWMLFLLAVCTGLSSTLV